MNEEAGEGNANSVNERHELNLGRSRGTVLVDEKIAIEAPLREI